MLLRKQTAYAQAFEATMTFSPSRIGYEAGIVLWWNQFSHATVGVTLVATSNGGREAARTVVARNATGQAGVMKVSSSLPSVKLNTFPGPVFYKPAHSSLTHALTHSPTHSLLHRRHIPSARARTPRRAPWGRNSGRTPSGSASPVKAASTS